MRDREFSAAVSSRPWLAVAVPVAASLVGGLVLVWWLLHASPVSLQMRLPGADHASGGEGATGTNAVLAGHLVLGSGLPAKIPGSWTGFRGVNRDGLARLVKLGSPAPEPPIAMAHSWGPSGPRELWSVDLGEGYAGPAVANGRVYLMDYDREKKQDALRCLSLGDGQEIWRFAYPDAVKRNHGMSRTVPALADGFVVAMGPKCHVVCLDATTGALQWGIDLVRQFGTTVPPWYAGQCPLVANGVVVLAPGGPDALLTGVELKTGRVLWKTPNPHGWKMTHSSIMPMDLGGQGSYVYCASLGVVGVSANDGSQLWESTDWKISIATVPSPLVLAPDRIFFSGGYNAGSLMLQVQRADGRWIPKTLFRLDPEVFGATQQTPVFYDGRFYGVRPDAQFTCLDLNGKVLWSSGSAHTFGLGSFLLADGLIYALNDSGLLSLIEAAPDQFHLLAQAQVLKGHESWGPMALVGGRLLARDLTRMVCLDVTAQ